MNFIYKHYYILVIFLSLILSNCLFFIFWYKSYPKFLATHQEMNLIGMRSNDKLITYKLLQDNIGLNKLLSYSGVESKPTIKSSKEVDTVVNCIDAFNFKDKVIKLSFSHESNVKINKNFTIYNLKMLKDLDVLKRNLSNDLDKLLNENFSRKNNSEKNYFIEICTLVDSINQFMSLVEKDPDKINPARMELRRCYLNTNECKLQFFRHYWSSNDKTFNIYLKLTEKNLIEYENKTKLTSAHIPLDTLVTNTKFTQSFLNLFNKYSVKSIDFMNNSKINSEHLKNLITSKFYFLLFSWLLVNFVAIFLFNTILILITSNIIFILTILVSYICFFYSSNYFLVHNFTNSLSIYNLTSVITIYLIILSDSLIISICYSQSRKLISNSKAIITNRSKRISKNTLKQSFYYIVPKNLAFVFILFVSYLNQIDIIQKFAYFLVILIINYLILGTLGYLFICLFLSNYHHVFWYKHQIKIFDIDLNESIKKYFSSFIPYLVSKLKYVWILIFGLTSLVSLIGIFYYPKFDLDPRIIETKNEGNKFKILITWGSKINQLSKNYKTIESLLDIDMETQAYEQFNSMLNFCNKIKNEQNQNFEILKVNCFGDNFFKYLNKKSQNLKNEANLELLSHVESTLNKPNYKMYENNCELPNRMSEDLIKKLYTECIKWWSLKIMDYKLKENLNFKSSPIFLNNRLVPSLFFIEIETNLLVDSNFNRIQVNFNLIESWWKKVLGDFNLNENYVWWTSTQLENYFFQKKSNQQILLTCLVSLIMLLAITIYSCSKLLISFLVFLNILAIISSVTGLLTLLNFKINLFNIILFILEIFIAAQYSLVQGVSLRFSPHIDLENSLTWSFSNFAGSLMTFFILITFGSLPLLFTTIEFYKKLGIVLILTNFVSYLYTTFFLPSFLHLTSDDFLNNLDGRLRGRRDFRLSGNRMGRHVSTSSFAPSIVYSHAYTISTYFENDLTDIGEYRRRTLSRCNSSLNSHKNSIVAFYNNTSARNSIVNQNPNFLQIPRSSRLSVRRISNQSRRSSYLHSRKSSNAQLRRSSRRLILDAEKRNEYSRRASHLTLPKNNNQIMVDDTSFN